MKKILLTLALFGASLFTGCSKKSAVTREKGENHIETDGLLKYEYIYTDDSRTIICSAKKDSNSEYEEYCKYYTKYDKDNFVVEDTKYVFSNEDNDWVGEERTINSYSEDHLRNLQVVYEYSEDSDIFDWIWRIDYKMDIDYKKIKGKYLVSAETSFYWDGTPDEKTVYTYDSKGVLISYDEYDYDYDTKTLEFDDTVKVTYENKMETHTYSIKKDGNLVETYKEVYEYNDSNKELSRACYVKKNGEWTIDSKSISEYADGKLKSYSDIFYEDGKKSSCYKSEYEYADNGYVIQTSLDDEEGELKPFSKYTYLLDKFENEIYIRYLDLD